MDFRRQYNEQYLLTNPDMHFAHLYSSAPVLMLHKSLYVLDRCDLVDHLSNHRYSRLSNSKGRLATVVDSHSISVLGSILQHISAETKRALVGHTDQARKLMAWTQDPSHEQTPRKHPLYLSKMARRWPMYAQRVSLLSQTLLSVLSVLSLLLLLACGTWSLLWC